jgi:HEAT repeat protein
MAHFLTGASKIGATESVQPLIVLVREAITPDVRRAAAKALGEIGDTSAIKGLVACLGDGQEDLYVREGAAWALGKLAEDKGIAAATAALVSTAVADENREIADEVARLLMKLGEPAIKQLVAALSTTDENVILRVAKLLAITRAKAEAVQPLIALLNSEEDGIVWAAVDLLGEIGDERAVEPLLVGLTDETKDSYHRGVHVPRALARIGSPKAVELLISVLGDIETHLHDDYVVQCSAVAALGVLGNQQAFPPLAKLLLKRDNPTRIRGLAAWALGMIGGQEAPGPLAKALEDRREDSFVRYNAAWALVHMDDKGASYQVLEYLKDHPEARNTIFAKLDYLSPEPQGTGTEDDAA